MELAHLFLPRVRGISLGVHDKFDVVSSVLPVLQHNPDTSKFHYFCFWLYLVFSFWYGRSYTVPCFGKVIYALCPVLVRSFLYIVPCFGRVIYVLCPDFVEPSFFVDVE